MGNKSPQYQRRSIVVSPQQQQIFTTSNINNNDQTVVINKNILQNSNNMVNRQSRFIVTDNNATIRPVSRSTSRSKDNLLRDNSINRQNVNINRHNVTS